MYKRGQVTIFIILALIIVIAISVFFVFYKPSVENTQTKKLQIENCIEDELQKPILDLALRAGIQKPTFTTMYMDENISFICYTDEYYKPCVVQYPFLKQTLEENLAKIMKSKIEKCYEDSVDNLKLNGYDVTSGEITEKLEIIPDKIRITIDAPTTIKKGESSQSMREPIEININSELYTILTIANSILQFETSYGDAEISSFTFYYPELNIQKIRRDGGNKIYIITDKKDIKYQFATRSYAWPAGYGVYK
jgi:hypothetical protein